jgi:hypothetical protein
MSAPSCGQVGWGSFAAVSLGLQIHVFSMCLYLIY